MGGYRAERIAEMVHKEVAQRLHMDVKDHRLVPLSITHVDVTRDLSRATVHVMPLGGGAIGEDLADALSEAARQLRGPIGRALRLRHAPELVFQADEHTEQAIHVTSLLDELTRARGDSSDDADTDGEPEEEGK